MKLVLPTLCSQSMIICSSQWKSFATSHAIRPLAHCTFNHGASTPPHRHHTHYSYSTTQSRLEAQLGSSMKNTLETTLDWNDRIGLQGGFTLEQKGWKVQVDWRSTPHGAGLFSKQDIEAGALLRRGIFDVNLKEFTSVADIDNFCRSGETERGDINNTGYKAKIDYVKDYLWGFNREADDRGYDKTESPPSDTIRFFGMWIPGNGLNHNEIPNTVYKATADGIDLVALVDIQADDELFDDYRRHGTSSPWLKEFANIHNVTLNFADCNEFV